MLLLKTKNKKGQVTWLLFVVLIVLFISMIGFLVTGLVASNINSALDQNISVGQVNLADTNAVTFGKLNSMLLTHADWMGVATIFGMILGLFLSSYFTRNRMPKEGMVLDIFIIFGTFLFSTYLSNSYQSLLDALSIAGVDYLETNLPKSSLFMLNLPIFTTIIGVVMMVLFHSSLPRKKEETIRLGSPF